MAIFRGFDNTCLVLSQVCLVLSIKWLYTEPPLSSLGIFSAWDDYTDTSIIMYLLVHDSLNKSQYERDYSEISFGGTVCFNWTIHYSQYDMTTQNLHVVTRYNSPYEMTIKNLLLITKYNSQYERTTQQIPLVELCFNWTLHISQNEVTTQNLHLVTR